MTSYEIRAIPIDNPNLLFVKEIAYQLAVMNEQMGTMTMFQVPKAFESLGSTVPPGSDSALRGGYYWVWYDNEWRLAQWDGEDWDILGWGATVPRRHVSLGPRIIDKPTSGPPTQDLADSPDSTPKIPANKNTKRT
jgi:hypothetical protein